MNGITRFRPLAQAEFEESAERYSRVDPDLGFRFADAVRRTVSQIAATPHRYPIVEADVREAMVPGFPYSVYYRCRSELIIILAVYHHSRDPDGWRNRIS